MIKIGIIGANGYTGFELMRLLSPHPDVKITYIASRSNAGVKAAELYPALSSYYCDITYKEPDAKACAKACDVAFTCLPHAASAAFGAELISCGVKVIDLSADFRYDDTDLYEKTYGVTHPAKKLNAEAVYGLTEINRDKIKGARIIGNPGCYTTSSILPLYPLIKENLISECGIIIDAKSGVTGAGRKADVNYSYCETDENFKAYAVTTHRHTSEIEEKLSVDGKKVALSFTPHLLPVKRGILSTVYADLQSGATGEKIAAAYDKYYGKEKFVTVFPEGTLPELKWVVGSNTCKIGYKVDKRLNKVIIVSCIDNLIKGAAGQAIQNMNVMFNLDESKGLPLCANGL